MKFVCFLHLIISFLVNLPTTEKPKLYQQLIDSLPKVYFKTLRKLLGHLQEIISHESRNLASLRDGQQTNPSNAGFDISLLRDLRS